MEGAISAKNHWLARRRGTSEKTSRTALARQR